MRANRDHGFRFAPPVATRLGPSGAKVLRGQGTPGPRYSGAMVLVQQTSKAPVNGDGMTEPCSSDRKKVLVIDDELSIIAYLTTVLEDEGYETCSAMDCEEGLAVAREQLPDLITLDIMMPKRSGLALYRDLKLDSELHSIPVIFVTAFNRGHDLWPTAFRRMVPDGTIPLPEGYIEKPIDVAAFLETVTFLIRCAAPKASADGEAAS